MKRTKFSLLKLKLSALLLCTSIFLTACNFFNFGDNSSQQENSSSNEEPSETIDSNIYGDWKSTYGEKYSISKNDYDNYCTDKSSGEYVLYYSTTNIEIVPIDGTKGFIYGQFDDKNHIGYGASVNQWYALYYDNLTSSSVSFYQPYKYGGKAGCDTLAEAKTEYTLDNGYFDLSNPSECTK